MQIIQALPRSAGARRRHHYEIDALTERYRTAILLVRDGLDCSAAFGAAGIRQPSPLSPVAIAKADGRTVGSYYCADLGVTHVSGVVSGWDDQWGANNLSEATSNKRPALVVESTLNRRSSITGDGSNDALFGGPNPPLPGTTPYGFRLLARCNSFVASARLLGGTIRSGTTSNTVIAFNGGGSLSTELTMTDGVWYRVRSYSTNSSSDYFRVGANTDTTNLGNGDRTALPLFSDASGSNNGAFSIPNLLYFEGADLSAAADRVLEQFYIARHGDAITL